MYTCCFTGHRQLSLSERRQISFNLRTQINELIKKGTTVFRCGGALGFDTIAALYILEVKRQNPNITLIIDVPHKNQSCMWNETDKHVYDYVLSYADEVNILSEKYYKGCMQARNRFMVDHSDFVIAYVKRSYGGSYYTAAYAVSNDKKVIYI